MAAIPIAFRLYQALCVILKCFKIYSKAMLVVCLLSHPPAETLKWDPLDLAAQDLTQILIVPFPHALPSSFWYNPYKVAIQRPNCLPCCGFCPQQGIPQVMAQRKAWRTTPEGTGVVAKPGLKLCHQKGGRGSRAVAQEKRKTGLGTVRHALSQSQGGRALAWPAYSTNSWIFAVKWRALGGCRDSSRLSEAPRYSKPGGSKESVLIVLEGVWGVQA